MKIETKVIIIGLDGGTWTLIKPWMEKGELPTFNKLIKGEFMEYWKLRSLL